MYKFYIKTKEEIEIIRECGQKLAKIKKVLFAKVGEGVKADEIETLASELIKKERAEASFKRVPGYSWATCVNVNAGLVHGIPQKEIVFKKRDIVSVDLGLLYKSFNTDCSFTKGIEVSPESVRFLKAGREALEKAIQAARTGNRIYDISEAIEKTITSYGYSPIRALVGHGVGKNLHEDPPIPCFLPGKKEESMLIPDGAVLAIEVMYALGKPDLVRESDGWTISTRDGKISALFEETVAVTKDGPMVLTT
jgi:methionyl aminopeptidase